MDLTGKNVLVTGGAKGIGRALVAALAGPDTRVCVLDTDREAVDQLLREYPEVDGEICDIGDPTAVQAAVDAIAVRHRAIHILVNNAALIFNSPLVSFGLGGITSHSVEMWDKVIRTDLSGVFYVTAAVVRNMMQRRTKGVVVSLSSVAAVGNAGQGAYSAAKAGVNALTVAWAKELGPLGIRFVAIAPGFTNTETTVRVLEGKVLENWVKQTPLRRMGTPDDIVQSILFAIQNDFLTGKVIEVDGGLRL